MTEEKRHPIEVVSRRTGLSKDLLRAWERRYGAVRPDRSSGGRRLYSDGDVERLLLLRRATGAGRQIRSVVHLEPEQLASLVREDETARRASRTQPEPAVASAEAHYVAAGLAAIENLDSSRLRTLLERAAAALGTEGFATGVAGPLLQEVGDGWHRGSLSPRHEHLASAALRGVLTRLAGVGEIAPDAPGIVVATPAGQSHEFGALLIAAVAASRGWRVTYLGSDLPASDIAETVAATGARAVALSLVYPAGDPNVADELRELRRSLPSETELLLGGRCAQSYAAGIADAEARLVADLSEFCTGLEKLAAEPVRAGT